VTGLVRSELSKLASARSTWWMLGIGLAVEGLFAGLLAGLLPADELSPDDTSDFLLTGSSVLFLLNLVLGSLLVTGEYRHRTANWTLTAEPRRWRVIGSKAIVAGLVGLASGVAMVAVNAALALPLLESRGLTLPGSSEIVDTYAGDAVAFLLVALFGLGLGAIVRNQVAAVVTGIALFTVVGGLTGLLSDDVSQYFVSEATAALQGFSATDSDPMSQAAGGGLFAVYCAAAIALGGALFARRDITD
jgi:ABC-2 type transport system permease protein